MSQGVDEDAVAKPLTAGSRTYAGETRHVGGTRPAASRPAPGRRRSAARDALLAQVRSTTRWVGVAAAVAIGILTVYVGRAFPGHARTSGTGSAGASGSTASSGGSTGAGATTGTQAVSAGSTRTASGTASSGTASSGTTSSGTTLTPATQAPISSSTSSGVVSGAS